MTILSRQSARVVCRLPIVRRVAVAGIAFLCSAAVFAQSREEVRHHQAMDDSLTGARIGETIAVIQKTEAKQQEAFLMILDSVMRRQS